MVAVFLTKLTSSAKITIDSRKSRSIAWAFAHLSIDIAKIKDISLAVFMLETLKSSSIKTVNKADDFNVFC